MHSEMWWPRLFTSHGEIAWDDYEKDYSDLPPEVRPFKWCNTFTKSPTNLDEL